MRLVCPNCGAQYEVDDRVVPDAGRDVQCSNCGHAWFQRSARAIEDESAAPLAAPTPDELPAEEDSFDDDEQEHHGAAQDDYDDDYGDEETGPEVRPEMPKPTLDAGVRSILEEEAALEMQAREQDHGGIETQPDLGLDSQPDPEAERRRIARERMSRMRGIEDGETFEHEVQDEDETQDPTSTASAAVSAAVAAARKGQSDIPRRDVFPDIEEINSTLDSQPDHDPGNLSAEEVQVVKRGGFKRSFSIVIILAALALAIYVFAPKIAELVPALKPVLAAYVDAINGFRGWIEGLMQNTIDKIEDAAQPAQSDTPTQ